MTVPPITDARPISDAVAVMALTELAEKYERTAKTIAPRSRRRYELYAAAIRWALDLTAFPVDAETRND